MPPLRRPSQGPLPAMFIELLTTNYLLSFLLDLSKSFFLRKNFAL